MEETNKEAKSEANYICRHGVCAWKDEMEYKCEGCVYYVPAEEVK